MKTATQQVFGNKLNNQQMQNQLYLRLLLFSIIGVIVLAAKPNSKSEYNNQYDKPINFKIDTAKSKLNWKCAHVGTLKINNGKIITDGGKVKEIDINIDMTSIRNSDINNDLLQGTLQNVLKSIEFFNTEKYPESRFESHLITELDNNKYQITGDFIIFENGICTNIEGIIEIKNDSLYFNTEPIIINRTDWGIYYLSKNNKYPKKEEANFVVSDSIFLEAQIVAYKTD